MKKIKLRVEGMTCSACSNGLEKYLNKQDGIVDAVVNLVLQEVSIQYEDNITISRLEELIKEAGFKSLGEAQEIDILKVNGQNKKVLILFGFLTAVIFYFAMGSMVGLPSIIDKNKYPGCYALSLLILTLPYFYFGRDIIKSGLKNIKYKIPNMDTLVTLSVLCSFLYSIYSVAMIMLGNIAYIKSLYFDSVAMVIFFVKLGRYIEGNSRSKTVSAIRDLVQITPTVALLKDKSLEREVTIDEVKMGDILVVKPGMKVAVDGIVLKGSSHLDESFITGESVPVKKGKGDKVIAGSINYDGVLEYKALRIGRESTISEIVHLVMDATNTKAPIARLADKLSGYFVPVLLLITILTFVVYLMFGAVVDEALNVFVTILVVACPCALGLATPLAIVVATGMAAKGGILIRTSEVLENASKVDTFVFDKTGTLTEGNLAISRVYRDSTYKEKDLLKIVASIEKNSTHPIGNTFIEYAKKYKFKLLEVEEFENISGMGVKGKIDDNWYYLGNNKLITKLELDNPYEKQELELTKLGNSIVYVIMNNKVIALIGIKDLIRAEAKEVISNLKNMNKQVVMLTGDNQVVAKLVAEELGIDEVIADVTPKEKSKIISQLKDNGKKVMMIGDGINDAPSLALADIGVSLEGASDIATNTADIIILKNDLTRIVSLVIISKKTLKNIHENLFWACFYNMCMIPIAMGLFKPLGICISPVSASIAMTISSLTVVFNALRLKRIIKV